MFRLLGLFLSQCDCAVNTFPSANPACKMQRKFALYKKSMFKHIIYHELWKVLKVEAQMYHYRLYNNSYSYFYITWLEFCPHAWQVFIQPLVFHVDHFTCYVSLSYMKGIYRSFFFFTMLFLKFFFSLKSIKWTHF